MTDLPRHARKMQGGEARRQKRMRCSSGNAGLKRDQDLLMDSTDFQNNVHRLICQAHDFGHNDTIKYKVHAPSCVCEVISILRKRTQDVDGSSSAINDPFNNLVVVPSYAASQSPAVFICENTTEQSFQKDATSCEEKLARELFGNGALRTRFSPGSANARPFEVTCAQCLLMRNQKNGFVAIVSQSFDVIQAYIQQARDAAAIKARSKELDAGHYHFIAALELSTLQSLLCSVGKERDQANVDILKEMANGDVELSKEMIRAFQSKGLASAYPDGLERNVWLSMEKSPRDLIFNIGHHLMYILSSSLSQQDQEKYFEANHNQACHLGSQLKNLSSVKLEKYVMVAGFIDGKSTFELDLPGGKRYLGESTFDDVTRRLDEECSLQMDKSWMSNRISTRFGGSLSEKVAAKDSSIAVIDPGDDCNVFFIMAPHLEKIDGGS
ncbi:hypothetical protein ACHAWF_010139 [Thalassiosira exigua]